MHARTRHRLGSVLTNTLGSFVSRNSDHQGYWLLGFLPRAPTPILVDLLATEVPGEAPSLEAFARHRAQTVFQRLLGRAGFVARDGWTGSLTLTTRATGSMLQRSGTACPAYDVHCVAVLTPGGGGGVAIERSRSMLVASHDPRLERQSVAVPR